MWCFNMFEGDDCGHSHILSEEPETDVMNIQFVMYDYISTSLRREVKYGYFYAYQRKRYFDDEEIVFMEENESHDHRLIQDVHDPLSAVFRWHVFKGIIKPTFFPTNEEIRDFFDGLYCDVDFLNRVADDRHFLCQQWYDFCVNEISNNDALIRNMGRMLFPRNEMEQSEKWEYAHKAALIVKRKYDFIKWTGGIY